MQFCSRFNIPVSLYCHAPITPYNLSCFRNGLPTFHCRDLYVQNQYTLKLFARKYSPDFMLPSIRVCNFSASASHSGVLASSLHSSFYGSNKITFLLLPENLLSEVFIFLRFISGADSSNTFILRLHPRTTASDIASIERFIKRRLSGLSITVSTSSLLDDSNSSFYSIFRSSSAILSTLVNSNSIPVYLNIPDNPCPNPLYFLHSSLYLSCTSFSDINSTAFVRPSMSFYGKLLV